MTSICKDHLLRGFFGFPSQAEYHFQSLTNRFSVYRKALKFDS